MPGGGGSRAGKGSEGSKKRSGSYEGTGKGKGTDDRAQSCGLLPAHISVLMTIIIQRICQPRSSSVDNYIISAIRSYSFFQK